MTTISTTIKFAIYTPTHFESGHDQFCTNFVKKVKVVPEKIVPKKEKSVPKKEKFVPK